MQCTKCGAGIDDESTVCSKCGNEIKNQSKGGNLNRVKVEKKTNKLINIICGIIFVIGTFIVISGPKVTPKNESISKVPSKVEIMNKNLTKSLIGRIMCDRLDEGDTDNLSEYLKQIDIKSFNSKLLYEDTKDDYERYIVFNEMEYTIMGSSKIDGNFITFILYKNNECYVNLAYDSEHKDYGSCIMANFDYNEAKRNLNDLKVFLDLIPQSKFLSKF